MAKICSKCGKEFPKNIWHNGKKINLQRRKYCFDCSPLGYHNTKQLEKPKSGTTIDIKKCPGCDRDFKKSKSKYCPMCVFQKRMSKISDKVYGIVGETCWKCGYNKGKIGRKILDFHHVNPLIKEFNLTTRETTNFKWERVIAEMKKCVLLCSNCHREVHLGIIDPKEIDDIYEEYWKKLDRQ